MAEKKGQQELGAADHITCEVRKQTGIRTAAAQSPFSSAFNTGSQPGGWCHLPQLVYMIIFTSMARDLSPRGFYYSSSSQLRPTIPAPYKHNFKNGFLLRGFQ